MSVLIREANDKSDLKQFVEFQFKLYKGNKYWVPPIKKDEIKCLMPEHNPAFEFCKAKFWLAYKGSQCVGRIGGIINEKYNEKTGEKTGRFTRVEFINDAEVSSKLFETVENWATAQGMTAMHGPLGFTNLDHQALLIEGFDHLPSIASEYHLPYYKGHLEKLGYEKEIDWVEFRLKIEDSIPEKALRLNEIIKKRYGLHTLSFTKTSELKSYGKRVFHVLNDAFDGIFSMVRLNDKMIDYYINRYFSMLNPKFVKIVEDKNRQVVGFIIALPSLSKAMQKANGKLFPFGFYHIMKALKNPIEMDLVLTGVSPKMQGMGVAVLLISELQKVFIQHRIKYVETTGIIETNHKAIQHWKDYDHIQHKRKRCFRKEL